MARRTTTADVASRRHRTAVTTNAGLSEYGFTKFGVTPDGGERAGTRSLGLLLYMMLIVLTTKKIVECYAQVNSGSMSESDTFVGPSFKAVSFIQTAVWRHSSPWSRLLDLTGSPSRTAAQAKSLLW